MWWQDCRDSPGLTAAGCAHYFSEEDFQERKWTCPLRIHPPAVPLWPGCVMISTWTTVTVRSHGGEADTGVLKRYISCLASGSRVQGVRASEVPAKGEHMRLQAVLANS